MNTSKGYDETGERPDRSTLFERDAIGRLMAKVNRDARQDFDLLGRLTQEMSPTGALDYEYDLLSNLTTLTLPDGRKVTCTS